MFHTFKEQAKNTGFLRGAAGCSAVEIQFLFFLRIFRALKGPETCWIVSRSKILVMGGRLHHLVAASACLLLITSASAEKAAEGDNGHRAGSELTVCVTSKDFIIVPQRTKQA